MRLLGCTHPAKAADGLAARHQVNWRGYAAARCRRSRFQFQGRSSSIRLAG